MRLPPVTKATLHDKSLSEVNVNENRTTSVVPPSGSIARRFHTVTQLFDCNFINLMIEVGKNVAGMENVVDPTSIC